jgi:hypothetical protein
MRAHGRPAALWHSDIAQLVAVAAVGVAWGLDMIPIGPVVVLAVIAVYNIAAVRGPVQRVIVVGLQQTAFGVAVVAVTAVAVLA